MKNYFLLSITICFAILQSCSSKGEQYDGKWVTKDIRYEVDVDCSCTEEEKAELLAIVNSSIDDYVEQVKPTSYLIFEPDYTVTGKFFGDDINGKYEATSGEIFLTLEGYKDEQRIQIIRIGEEQLMQLNSTQNELEKLDNTINYPQYGEVKMTFNKLNLILEESSQQ